MRGLRFSTFVTHRAAMLILGAAVAVDQATKYWARTNLVGAPREVIPNVLSWEYAENTGAAFGMLRGLGVGAVLSVAAVIAIGVVVYALGGAERNLEKLGLALVGGGAAGNLVDRITNSDEFLRGFVVDWIRLPNFPNFNVADSAISIGAVLLILMAWQSEREKPEHVSQPDAASDV